MSRKSFIESQGATCRNWNWSWSFINGKEKFVIFGAWDKNTEGTTALILDEAWERNYAGRKNPAYPEAREHIRLVEEEGYSLKTFPIIYSDERKDENGVGPATIKGFVPELTSKILKRVGGKWYASDGAQSPQLPEEIDHPEKYIEGASRTVAAINKFIAVPKVEPDFHKQHYDAIEMAGALMLRQVIPTLGLTEEKIQWLDLQTTEILKVLLPMVRDPSLPSWLFECKWAIEGAFS